MSEEAAYETIKLSIADGIATLSLNRPDSLNAFTNQLVDEVLAALDAIEDDDEVRVVILKGEGRCFSSGYDLAFDEDSSAWGVVEWKRDSARGERYARRIWSFPKPIIAQVHSYCLAGACEIAMLCDMTIASDDARFGEPEIRFSTGSPALIMPWVVPLKIAKELLYSGKLISAERAREIGMVNHVVPRAELDERTRREALLLTKIAPFALQLAKEGLNGTYEVMGFHSALTQAASLAHILGGTPTEEFKEFERIRLAQGMKAALRWRDEQFAGLDDEP